MKTVRIRGHSRDKAASPINSTPLIFLVVDDVAAIVQVLTVVLTSLGHSVLTATNGRDALELFMGKGGAIDVVLMDCEMPIMGGFEAARAMRDAEEGWLAADAPHVTIVATSANSLCEDSAQCRESGIDFFIAKPVRRVDVERVIAFRRQLLWLR